MSKAFVGNIILPCFPQQKGLNTPSIIKRTLKIPYDIFCEKPVNIFGETVGIILGIHFVFFHLMQHETRQEKEKEKEKIQQHCDTIGLSNFQMIFLP